MLTGMPGGATQAVLALQGERPTAMREVTEVSSRSSRTRSCSTSWTDPLERANLKDRQRDDYRRMVRNWFDWNATMLPEIEASFTSGISGEDMADHYGAKQPDQKPDLPTPPKD